MAGVEAGGVDVGPPAAVAAADRAGDVAVAERHAADVDPVDLLAVGGELRREAGIEAGGAGVDLADAGDLLVFEVEHELGRARLSGVFLPSGLGYRQRGVAQVEQR